MASNESQKSKDSEESEVYRRKFYIPLNGDYPAAIERAPVYVRRFLSFWEDGIHPVCGRGSALKTDIRNWLQKEGMWKEEYDSDYEWPCGYCGNKPCTCFDGICDDCGISNCSCNATQDESETDDESESQSSRNDDDIDMEHKNKSNKKNKEYLKSKKKERELKNKEKEKNSNYESKSNNTKEKEKEKKSELKNEETKENSEKGRFDTTDNFVAYYRGPDKIIAAKIIYDMVKDNYSNESTKHRSTNGGDSNKRCHYCGKNKVLTAVATTKVWQTFGTGKKQVVVHTSCHSRMSNFRKKIREGSESTKLRKAFWKIVKSKKNPSSRKRKK